MWWSSSSTRVGSNLERLLGGITPKPPSFSLAQVQVTFSFLTLKNPLEAYSHVFNYTLLPYVSYFYTVKIIIIFYEVFFSHVETRDNKLCFERDAILLKMIKNLILKLVWLFKISRYILCMCLCSSLIVSFSNYCH